MRTSIRQSRVQVAADSFASEATCSPTISVVSFRLAIKATLRNWIRITRSNLEIFLWSDYLVWLRTGNDLAFVMDENCENYVQDQRL
jgi:hypothetical protein